MLTLPPNLQKLLEIAPDWEPVVRNLQQEGLSQIFDIFNRLGAKAIYQKARTLKERQQEFLALVRGDYFHPHLEKMLTINQNLRRFWSQRRLASNEQRQQAISLSTDLAQKLYIALDKHLQHGTEDGFKVLLPAYIQRTVQNASVDYIRQEWQWEKHTLQDINLDPNQDDPRHNIADSPIYAPENMAISSEKVGQLNQLRKQLEALLADPKIPKDALFVIDCLFGLGLSEHSAPGAELTMRECCDKLNIRGETQARRIARCQVLLDKGLDIVRQSIREHLPGIVECWQSETNVNVASRRELAQQLGLTEGEIERLIKNRQFHLLEDLVKLGVVKESRIDEIKDRGAVAAFKTLDINTATVRDLMDILGLNKDLAQLLAKERPFRELNELSKRNLLKKNEFELIKHKGAVVASLASDGQRIDLNRAEITDILSAGVADSIASLIAKGRPFATWAELEEFLLPDPSTWSVLRQKFCLGLTLA